MAASDHLHPRQFARFTRENADWTMTPFHGVNQTQHDASAQANRYYYGQLVGITREDNVRRHPNHPSAGGVMGLPEFYPTTHTSVN